MAITRKALLNELMPGLNKLFDLEYNFEPYILEQCGKQYRVKTNNPALWLVKTEYKTGWLPLKEAQAIMKLLKGNENDE
jgi:hypothetical protein